MAPGPVPPPDAAAPEGEFGFTFDRSGYRVPAILVSPWVEPGAVYNEEYRHTSLIATLRKAWDSARRSRNATPRLAPSITCSAARSHDPDEWATFAAQPVPEWTMDPEVVGKAISGLGKDVGPGLIEKARELASNSRRNSTIQRRTNGRAHRRGHQGCLLALLPGVGACRRGALTRVPADA